MEKNISPNQVRYIHWIRQTNHLLLLYILFLHGQCHAFKSSDFFFWNETHYLGHPEKGVIRWIHWIHWIWFQAMEK